MYKGFGNLRFPCDSGQSDGVTWRREILFNPVSMADPRAGWGAGGWIVPNAAIGRGEFPSENRGGGRDGRRCGLSSPGDPGPGPGWVVLPGRGGYDPHGIEKRCLGGGLADRNEAEGRAGRRGNEGGADCFAIICCWQPDAAFGPA